MSGEWLAERTTVEPGQAVLPFYLVCDVSRSMVGDVQALNDGIWRLWRAVATEPVVDDVARVSILTFSDTAKVILPLGQMSIHDMPVLFPERGTNYGAVFRLLAETIVQDTAQLKRLGYRVYRPCAFFLSKSGPDDPDWYQTFRDTLTRDAPTGMRMYPVFVPFGFPDAPEHVLRRLAYPPEKSRWYHSMHSNVEAALRGILNVIMTSIVESINDDTGRPGLVLPPPGPDFSWGDSGEWI